MKRDYSVAITVYFPSCFSLQEGKTQEELTQHVGSLLAKYLPAYMQIENVEDVTE